MKLLDIKNPFDAPVYYEETVSSTFDAARILAAQNEAHGTVITSDFQEAGRGRVNRPWITERGTNLLFTILLRYADFSFVPKAITLRTGLAVSLAVEDIVPALAGQVKVKWPNDIMIGSRKAAGILTESDGRDVFIGVGVNVAQKEYPPELASKAVSIKQAFPSLREDVRFLLLEKILLWLYGEIEKPEAGPPFFAESGKAAASWRERLAERLYKKGETVAFAEGKAGSNLLVEGTLSGIGPGGELLILPKGETKEKSFVTGELLVY